MITLYPIPDPRFVDDASDASMALVQRVVTAVRGLRSGQQRPQRPSQPGHPDVSDDYKMTILEGYRSLIAEQARCSEIVVRRSGDPPDGPVATAVSGEVEVMLILDATGGGGDAERSKLQKERTRLTADRDFFSRKLSNPDFVARAKPEVIEKDRAKLAEVEAAIARVESALGRLA